MTSQLRLFNNHKRFAQPSQGLKQKALQSKSSSQSICLFGNSDREDQFQFVTNSNSQTKPRKRQTYRVQAQKTPISTQQNIFSAKNDSVQIQEEAIAKNLVQTQYPFLNKDLSNFSFKPQSERNVTIAIQDRKSLKINLRKVQEDLNINYQSQSESFEESIPFNHTQVNIAERFTLIMQKKETKIDQKDKDMNEFPNIMDIFDQKKSDLRENIMEIESERNEVINLQEQNQNGHSQSQSEEEEVDEEPSKIRSELNHCSSRCMRIVLNYLRQRKLRLDQRMNLHVLRSFKSNGMTRLSIVKGLIRVDNLFCSIGGKNKGSFIKQIQDALNEKSFKNLMKEQTYKGKIYYAYLIDLFANIQKDIRKIQMGKGRVQRLPRPRSQARINQIQKTLDYLNDN